MKQEDGPKGPSSSWFWRECQKQEAALRPFPGENICAGKGGEIAYYRHMLWPHLVETAHVALQCFPKKEVALPGLSCYNKVYML